MVIPPYVSAAAAAVVAVELHTDVEIAAAVAAGNTKGNAILDPLTRRDHSRAVLGGNGCCGV